MHAHLRWGNAQRARDLFGILRHLDRRPDVQHFAPRVPARDDAERLDRYGGAAAPCDAEFQPPGAIREMLVDLAPHERLVEQDVAAVAGVHGWARTFVRLLAVDHERQWLVVDLDGFGSVLRECACVGSNGGDPFAHVARLSNSERVAAHVRCVEPVHHRLDGFGELIAGQHVVHAGHGEGGRCVDRRDLRRRVLRRHQRDMQRAVQLDVGDVLALAGHEAPVLAHPSRLADVAKIRGGHRGLPMPSPHWGGVGHEFHGCPPDANGTAAR